MERKMRTVTCATVVCLLLWLKVFGECGGCAGVFFRGGGDWGRRAAGAVCCHAIFYNRSLERSRLY